MRKLLLKINIDWERIISILKDIFYTMIVFLLEFPSDNWHISGNQSFQSDFKILMEFCSNLIVIKIAFGSFSISVLNFKFHLGKCVLL